MSRTSRRAFLGSVAAGASALLVPRSLWAGSRPVRLDPSRVGALADAVLPSHLGADGRAEVAGSFLVWLANYRPGAEMSHGYGSDSMELRYLPPDPTPRWTEQLHALEALARARFQEGFTALSRERRQGLTREALERQGGPGTLSQPEQAGHVAAALMAFWFRSPGAWNDALGARVDKWHARSLESATEKPAPLTGAEGRR